MSSKCIEQKTEGVIRTSMVLREPNIEISGWISTISLDQAFRISRSCASYHDGPLWLSALRLAADGSSDDEVVIGGSTGTSLRGSGLMPR